MTIPTAMRADRLIVARGLAPTRSAAQRLIARGAVRWRRDGACGTPAKPGADLPEDCLLELTDDAELRWASRGGLKLEGALDRTGLEVRGASGLDVGQGRGGFTDVLLARGAASVVGVDVGHGQLHPRLAADPRVRCLEGTNARSLDAHVLGGAMPRAGFELVVGDLSFISLTLVLPALAPLAAGGGALLLLVKPQFELQPERIGKGGLVKDAAGYAEVEQRLREACARAGLAARAWFESPIAGGDGNREFFIHATKP